MFDSFSVFMPKDSERNNYSDEWVCMLVQNWMERILIFLYFFSKFSFICLIINYGDLKWLINDRLFIEFLDCQSYGMKYISSF